MGIPVATIVAGKLQHAVKSFNLPEKVYPHHPYKVQWDTTKPLKPFQSPPEIFAVFYRHQLGIYVTECEQPGILHVSYDLKSIGLG
jgi:hypothetical protein